MGTKQKNKMDLDKEITCYELKQYKQPKKTYKKVRINPN